jgi:hypothetical protein
VMQLVLLFHFLKKRVHDSLSERYGYGLLCRSALKQPGWNVQGSTVMH